MKFALILSAAALAVFFATATPAPAKDEGDWVRLLSHTVDFRSERDIIELGKQQGHFTHLRFKVEEGDLLMDKMKITFGNGDTFEPSLRMEFKEGSRSHDIDLPGKSAGRVISKIEFVYRSEHKHDKATIVLYGREK